MTVLKDLINKRFNKIEKRNYFGYPLLDDAFSAEDINSAMEVLLSKKITMGEITNEFEHEFANYIGSKYALMVNSGSSANLLAAFALVNPLKKNHLNTGDEFLIQSLCWSTSLWPMVQAGLRPKFIDVNTRTLNIEPEEFYRSITKKTKAAMIVHVLGNCSDIDLITKIGKKKNLYLIEDTCESLGSMFKNKYLGTFGSFGTFSFYYSHQITSGEGGMIICDNKKDYQIIHSMRAHGWDRGLNKRKNNLKDFNFINAGFNLRPLDITAAIGLSQFKRLNNFKKTRNENRKKILNSLQNSKNWNNQFSFIEKNKNLKPSWFGLPMLIDKKYLHKKEKFLNFLNEQKVETRPIISGNFLDQPSIKLFNLNKKNKIMRNSKEISDRGFFIGLHTKPIYQNQINKLTKLLLSIDEI